MPLYLRIVLVALVGLNLVALLDDGDPGWPYLMRFAIALGLVGLVLREVRRNPAVLRSGRLLWVLAAAMLLAAVLALVASALS